MKTEAGESLVAQGSCTGVGVALGKCAGFMMGSEGSFAYWLIFFLK